MLVLTRKVGQVIFLGDRDTSITVVEIDRNKVRIGIKAPPGVNILREELADTIYGKLPLGKGDEDGV